MESENLTDEQLVLNFQGGDSNAYEVLVRRYRDKIIHFIFGYVRDMTAAEDLTQDTMFKFYVKKDSYREVAKFSTWLYTIAANLAKTELRKLKRRKTDSFTDINKRTERLFDIPAPEEKRGNGMLKINSKPIGAKVLINNKDEGLTPITIKVKEGKNRVILTYKGYERYTKC